MKYDAAGIVAEVALIPDTADVMFVVAAGIKTMLPCTSQSPALRLMLVMFAGVLVVRETPVPVLEMYSPTEPVLALSPVVVPLIPIVLDGVINPVADSVVNAPVLGVVAPTDALLIVPPEIVGDEIVGDVPNTSAPLPVSSETMPAS